MNWPEVALDEVRHRRRATGTEDLLGQEEAIRAVEFADRAGQLREQVKGRRRSATVPLRARCPVGSDPCLSLDAAGLDGGGERVVVVFALIGVGLRELGDRLVELIAAPEVRGDRDAVA